MDSNEQAAIRVGRLLKQQRAKRRITLDQAAREIGVSASTLSRWERRGSSESAKLPRQFDLETFQRISRWLEHAQVPLQDIERSLLQQVEMEPGTMSTPEVIEAHLRADRNLNSDNADLLIDLIRTAYERLASEPPKHGGQ